MAHAQVEMPAAIPRLSAELRRRHLTANELARMVGVGILGAAEHIELIDRELIVTPPRGTEHASLDAQLDGVLSSFIRSKDTFKLPFHSTYLPGGDAPNPEPELAVIHGAAQDFRTCHPRAGAAVLVG